MLNPIRLVTQGVQNQIHYTENMFVKEQLMRTRGLAGSLSISSISLLEHKALDAGHQVLLHVEEDDYHEEQCGGQKVFVCLGKRVLEREFECK